MGMFLFCLTIEMAYTRLRAVMGEEGALYTYCDDSCLLAEPGKMVEVMSQAPAISGKVGLRIGLGPGKKELILPVRNDKSTFPYLMNNLGVAAHHVVTGFAACLGIPRYFSND